MGLGGCAGLPNRPLIPGGFAKSTPFEHGCCRLSSDRFILRQGAISLDGLGLLGTFVELDNGASLGP